MALTNYSTISEALLEWLNREGHTAVTARAEDFIIMAQRRIQRELRIAPMEYLDESFTIDSQKEAIPTDFLELIDIVITTDNGNIHLERAPWDNVALWTQTGVPRYFARAGGNFWFAPIPDATYTAKLFYYREIEFISSATITNWFSKYAPELILTAAMIEASLYMKDDSRIEYLEGQYARHKALVLMQDDRDEYSSNTRIREEGIRLFGAP